MDKSQGKISESHLIFIFFDEFIFLIAPPNFTSSPKSCKNGFWGFQISAPLQKKSKYALEKSLKSH